ncbi:MAG: MFS transporter [Gemmataceae bacterium]|nr:MFS transporter [Gemmataceae bacterium]
MSRFPRWLILLCLASLLWSFSFGLGAPLASLWLKDAGASATVIGLNTATYYLGIALAASFVPALMRRGSTTFLFLAMIASGVTIALFPWGGSMSEWFVLRMLNGFAAALSLIPLETYVNRHSAPERRAEMFAYYALSIALGMALGTLTGLQLYAQLPFLAFYLGGTAAILGGGVILLWKPTFDVEEAVGAERTSLGLKKNFLSYGSAWSQGFLEGGMVALLPVYLKSVGLSEEGVGLLMGGLMIGVISFQVPAAWLADRLGRTPVLLGCYVVTLLGAGCLCWTLGVAWLAVWLFAVGACSGAFYPLGLALLGERLPASGVARATAWFLAINCAGSLTGPVIAGAAIDLWGYGSLFLVGGGAVLLVLCTWTVLQFRDAGTAQSDEQADVDDETSREAA